MKGKNRPRFTRSKDGQYRCTITTSYRFTEEEYTLLANLAEYRGSESVSTMFEYALPLMSLMAEAEDLRKDKGNGN